MDEQSVHILLFYKFARLTDPHKFTSEHLDYCVGAGLLGKVLVATEGINGSVSGTKRQVDEYKAHLTGYDQFSDIAFKEELSTFHPFKKMIVRVKNEIIRMDQELDLDNRGKYISPKELIDLYQSGEEFVILDTRNNYESDVGKFKDAITPDIDTFREFPAYVDGLDELKDKKVVTYCTGGIRCEKATSYMVARGFTDVYQLKDGILNFCQEYPDTVWEGKCFVFDQRLVSDVDPESKVLTQCTHCEEVSDRYQNCKHAECDKLFIICESCSDEYKGCCTPECVQKYEAHLEIKSKQLQGTKKKKAGTQELSTD